MGIYEELQWRGLIKDVSSPALKEKINRGGLTFYIGTDPTGDSLHIGHFSSFLISKRLKDAGHNPILLVGLGTGLIGDPKPDAERPIITFEQAYHNYTCLKAQAEKLFGFEVVNNYEWLKDINILTFLRDYGKYFNVNYILNKDIVKRRLDEGITFAEFTYTILQALDFMHLHLTRGVDLEVAGQDQWGNITSGIELVRKRLNEEVYGFTMPLLTKSDGSKFGKSNGKAIWLDINKTSSYEMYQFFINSEDEKVIDYLKFLTFLSKEEIESLALSQAKEPHLRKAHKALAKEVITFIHGEEEYLKALKISETFFKGNLRDLNEKELLEGINDLTKISIKEDINLLDGLLISGLASSKREARELIAGNSVSLNGQKINDINTILRSEDGISGKYFILRKGKKNYVVLERTA